MKHWLSKILEPAVGMYLLFSPFLHVHAQNARQHCCCAPLTDLCQQVECLLLLLRKQGKDWESTIKMVSMRNLTENSFSDVYNLWKLRRQRRERETKDKWMREGAMDKKFTCDSRMYAIGSFPIFCSSFFLKYWSLSLWTFRTGSQKRTDWIRHRVFHKKTLRKLTVKKYDFHRFLPNPRTGLLFCFKRSPSTCGGALFCIQSSGNAVKKKPDGRSGRQWVYVRAFVTRI